MSYQWILSNVNAVQHVLPAPMVEIPTGGDPLAEIARRRDPTRVLYNGLVPFAVAALEHFFSQTFLIMLRYDTDARSRIRAHSRKVAMDDVAAISDGNLTIEEVVARWYTFQNVNSIHSAFNEWFGINVWQLLLRRKRIGRRVRVLEEVMNGLIEFRHGIVHRFDLDFGMDKEGIGDILNSVRMIIEVFVDHLEAERGIQIRDTLGA